MAEQQNLSQFNQFLINNKDFLIEKYSEYFPSTNQTHITIKTIPTPSLIEYIYDIFSFSKYKNDPVIDQKIRSSLVKNVNDYITANKQKQNQPFQAQTAVEALTYCIQHNDMFSVQYDVEKSPKTRPTTKDSVGNFLVKVDLYNQNTEQTTNKLESIDPHIQSEPKKMTLSVSPSVNTLNSHVNKAKRTYVLPTGRQFSEQTTFVESLENQFNQERELLRAYPNDIIKKNAKLVFLNFCKNQMELGGKKTFDNLGQQASTMTIGKLLVYAKAYNIFNDQITKDFLIKRFKKLSEGKRSIDFQKFYILLTQLHIIDPTLYDRLQLHDQHLHKKIKFVKYPFYTQDQNPRQLLAHRSFLNKLTSHSGKMHQQLIEQLTSRKQQNESLFTKLQYPQRSINRLIVKQNSSRVRDQLLSPKDLISGQKTRDYSIDLSFIDKIVPFEENDQRYLSEHEIQHTMKRYSRKAESGAINNSSQMMSRKGSIVDNIRKRIQQIQHKQSNSEHKSSHFSRPNRYIPH